MDGAPVALWSRLTDVPRETVERTRRQIGVSIAMHGPGDRVKRHRHPYEEAYYVIKGEGVMYMEGEGEIQLRPGRSVYIPPNTIHGQVNTSAENDLWILCSLSPPPPEGESPELFE